jgi:hypothetical protein
MKKMMEGKVYSGHSSFENQSADYFLMPAGAVSSQWSYINLIQLVNTQDKD